MCWVSSVTKDGRRRSGSVNDSRLMPEYMVEISSKGRAISIVRDGAHSAWPVDAPSSSRYMSESCWRAASDVTDRAERSQNSAFLRALLLALGVADQVAHAALAVPLMKANAASTLLARLPNDS